jgi:hypothetical protein
MFNLKSLGKAFRDTGVLIGVVAATAGLAFAADPTALVPFFAIGPVGPVLVFVINAAARYGLDALKHRNDPKPE